jgi:hypothetical protein
MRNTFCLRTEPEGSLMLWRADSTCAWQCGSRPLAALPALLPFTGSISRSECRHVAHTPAGQP